MSELPNINILFDRRRCFGKLYQQSKGKYTLLYMLLYATDRPTVNSVKADSLFSYQPPVNLLALLILLPASYVLSPRWFHKVCNHRSFWTQYKTPVTRSMFS